MNDALIDKLIDLHKQATTERSHYYVAACCHNAIVQITSLQAALRSIQNIMHRRTYGTKRRLVHDYQKDFDAIRAVCEPIVGPPPYVDGMSAQCERR